MTVPPLCYRPVVFFRHLPLIAFLFPHAEIMCVRKYYFNLLFLMSHHYVIFKLRTLKFLKSASVCILYCTQRRLIFTKNLINTTFPLWSFYFLPTLKQVINAPPSYHNNVIPSCLSPQRGLPSHRQRNHLQRYWNSLQ